MYFWPTGPKKPTLKMDGFPLGVLFTFSKRAQSQTTNERPVDSSGLSAVQPWPPTPHGPEAGVARVGEPCERRGVSALEATPLLGGGFGARGPFFLGALRVWAFR